MYINFMKNSVTALRINVGYKEEERVGTTYKLLRVITSDDLKVIPLFWTAHLLLRIIVTSNTVKNFTDRLKRLGKATFALNKFLGPAKTTFNGKNGRYIQTRPSPFAEIDPLRLKLCLYRLIANKRAR